MTAHPEHAVGERCRKWNYSFLWTERHLQRSQTDQLRYDYDRDGADAVDALQTILKDAKTNSTPNSNGSPPDLYSILKQHHQSNDTLHTLWQQVHTVPDWVDWEQIARGQQVFYRYAIANIVGFALQGFVGENSAASGVVEVLIRTGGFSTRVLLRRLLETFQWLIQVTQSLSAVQPGGEGHRSTIRVRLLHSSVRQRILQLIKTRPDYFDIDRYGVPANTLDSIHSITTFSCNHFWLQLPRMGIHPTQQEAADYIALFRYLAYLLGTPTEYVSTPEQAKATMESMFLHELGVTETSRIVGHNFVQCVTNIPAIKVSPDFVEAGSRWFNGDELCDALELGRPGWLAYAKFGALCVLVTALAWAQWAVPALDRWMIAYWRRKLYDVVIMNKHTLSGGTKFGFKHVPEYGQTTGKEDAELEVAQARSPEKRGSTRALVLLVCAILGVASAWSASSLSWFVTLQ